MLFLLTGDVQIGKTRWLENLCASLQAAGTCVAGVVAPGQWVPRPEGQPGGKHGFDGAGRFEKLGIDNVLLPQGERIGFARRRDLAAEGEAFAEGAQAKAAKLGIRVLTNARTGKHTFSVYEGRDLTAGNTAGNAPCIFSQEFDNIVEQEYTNSVENLKTTAYVGGEEKEGVTRKVAEVGGSATGLSRDEVFINATDIVQEYENESGQTVTLTTAQYLALLSARGVEELEQYAETLAFGSKINTNANLKYGTDYDLGDRVTCINKRWNVRIDVRITEIAETYETSGEEIDITFGESLPALLTQIRQITK